MTSANLNDGVGVVRGNAVVGEQGIQETSEHAPLRGPHAEGQRGGCVVAYPHHLDGRVRKSSIQFQREVFNTRVLRLVISLEGTIVLNVEL